MKALSLSVQKFLPRLSFFKSRSKLEVKVKGSKILVLTEKVSPQGIQVYNMKALSLTVQKLLPRLSFFKSRSKLEVKVTGSIILVLTERSRHKEYRCVT